MELIILFFIINLNFVFSADGCDNITAATDASTCTEHSTSSQYSDYCCYYKKDGESSGFCKTIPYSSFNDKNKYEYIGNTLYQVDCGNARKVTLLEQCGDVNKANDASLDECQTYSTVLNSCCYVEGNDKLSKGCYWLGTKYEGEINYAGVNMDCFMDYLKFKLFYFVFLFLFF